MKEKGEWESMLDKKRQVASWRGRPGRQGETEDERVETTEQASSERGEALPESMEQPGAGTLTADLRRATKRPCLIKKRQVGSGRGPRGSLGETGEVRVGPAELAS